MDQSVHKIYTNIYRKYLYELHMDASINSVGTSSWARNSSRNYNW